mmetsp:Transcript_102220/g.234306  ORF Transcript_102220/g.234306 Transcript_102220/m.234306 type:complete len:639 (+) Transcript_102220:1147-3063(+)
MADTLKAKLSAPLLEAVQRQLPEVDRANERSKLSSEDVAGIARILAHDNHEGRKKFDTDVLLKPIFRPYFDLTLDEQREKSLQMLLAACEAGVVSVRDFERNPMNIFMAHEKLAEVFDGSVATKFTVQFNLFGGTVLRLGSEEHRRELPDKIDSAEVVGCFGLSELGYGNNAVEMETTATYDVESKEFVINTPSVLAWKYWITNGACHAHRCVVFAQLFIKGENYGVHGFLVPIRDEQLRPLPGCQIQDMGIKITMNGIDNAKLAFENVRIPRSALLSRWSKVEEDGTYVSDVTGRRNRFITLADQLLSGRLCISSMMVTNSKVLLYATVLYGASRMGLGASGKSDTPILDYQLYQIRVFPLVARFFAVALFHNYCKRRYATRYMEHRDVDHAEVVVLCSAVKPMAAWLADEVTNTCREVVGGVGFLQANGFTMGAHAGITAEGDARVLCMKLVKELMALIQAGTVTVKTTAGDLVTCLQTPELADLGSFCNKLGRLLDARLGLQIADLATKIEGALASQEPPWSQMDVRERFFAANMNKFSSEIQAVAVAFQESQAMCQLLSVVNSKGTSPDLAPGSNGLPGPVGLRPLSASSIEVRISVHSVGSACAGTPCDLCLVWFGLCSTRCVVVCACESGDA